MERKVSTGNTANAVALQLSVLVHINYGYREHNCLKREGAYLVSPNHNHKYYIARRNVH